MDQLDDKRGRRPRHNESASEVRRGEVGPKCNVGDEGEGRYYSERVEEAVIGHGIVGKDIPIMARLAKARRWSKR